MSVRVSTWVWHETTAKGSDLLVLLALADSANDDGECWPGVDTIGSKTRMSRATVFRRLDALEEGGLIERLRRGKRQTNVYRVCVPWVRSQNETPVRSQNETGEVSPMRRVKSHGRDLETSVETSVETTTRESSNRRKPEVALPADWRPNREHALLAAERSLDLSSEAFRFRAHADANDRRLRDWNAGFRMWLSKATPDPQQGRRTAWDRAQDFRAGDGA